MEEKDEAKIYLKEAERLREEALKIWGFLGEQDIEDLGDLKFIDEQIKIIMIPPPKKMKQPKVDAPIKEEPEDEDRVENTRSHHQINLPKIDETK